MFTQRATAYKLHIKDILSSEFVAKEGEPSYILINGKQVSRVRVMGTIVNKFTNDEKKSGGIVVDDGTDVITARGWENEFHLIDKSVIGQLVDVIGKVRKYNDDVYLTPEVVKIVKPDWLVVRQLELKKDKVILEPEVTVKNPKPKEVDAGLKEKVLEQIKNKGTDGATMDELVTLAGDRTKCIEALKALIEDDMIFEPRAGRYKLL